MSFLDRAARRRRTAAGWSAVLVAPPLFLGCDDRRASTAPTPTTVTPPAPAPVPAPAPQSFSLAGHVADTAYRSMVGARVEVVDGLRAGTFVLTDDHGHFSLPETFTGAVRIAASKDGYLSQTKTSTLPDTSRSTQPQGWLQFFLELPVPSANVTGAYHVTITADNSCASLPDETRTRTYIAQIAPGETPSGFVATLTGARFFTLVPCPWGRFAPEACTYNRFGIGIAGDYVGGSVGFVEQLSDSTYLIFSTLVEGSVTASGITASLDGSLLYCPDQPRRAEEGLECPAANAVSCTSRNHRLELTRR